MTNIKKSLAAIIASAATFGAALPAYAQAIETCPEGQFSALCGIGPDKVGTVIQTAVTIILIIAVVIALFFLIWGGVRWITSGGDKGKVEGARNTIVAAIIGLIIAFLAYFILQVVLGFFGLSLTTLELPKITG